MNYVCLFRESVNRFPKKPALADRDGRRILSYGELDSLSGRVAAKLLSLGLAEGSPVLIRMGRKAEYVAAYLGILKAALAAVPSSPEYPEARLVAIRQDCGSVLTIDETFFEDLEAYSPAVREPSSEDVPALLLYTSGSTGKPKGIRHTVRSLCDGAVRGKEVYKVKGDLVFAASAPLSFIAFVFEYLGPFAEGGFVHILSDEVRKDIGRLEQYYAEKGITMGFLSPRVLRNFRYPGGPLERVFSASERLSGVYTDAYEIINGYGMSETAGVALTFRVDQAYENTPIGKPVPGVGLRLIDEEGKEVPDGEEGEICLIGLFANEYLHLSELTAKTFIPTGDGQVLLHTGDLGRKLADGSLLYVNRKDWMVKINGQRVETGEIEAAMRAVPGVADAYVKDFSDAFGHTYLVGYYVSANDLHEELLAALSRSLAPYMIPRFLKLLPEIPKNANGKVDRAALLPPDLAELRVPFVAPETENEKTLCRVFGEVLGLSQVSALDDFFALGGDSISVMRLLSGAAELELTSDMVYQGKTPAGIAALLYNPKPQTAEAKAVEDRTRYPLTPSERGMYLEQKREPESTVYNLNVLVKIAGTTPQEAGEALSEVLWAHEALHSFYGEANGLPVRIVADRLPEIRFVEAEDEEETLEKARAYAVPFELGEIPVRPTFYHFPDGKLLLHFAIHHIAFDGGSARPFARELFAALRGEKPAASGPDLSDLAGAAGNPDREAGLSFYREMFKDGVPVTDLPIRGKRPLVHPLSDREKAFLVGEELLKKLDNCARSFGVTEFELLFGAVAMTMGKYTAAEDLVLGVPTNLRPARAQDVIGMFVNTAPVRVRPLRKLHLSEYLADTSAAVRKVTYGATLPFEDVVGEFVKARDESRNPMFDVSVNYLKDAPVLTDGALSLSLEAPLQKMSRDIGIVMQRGEEALKVIFTYSSELFEDEMIDRMQEQLQETLAKIAGGEDLTVRRALALPKTQEEALLAFSREAEAEVPVTLLHRLFEKNALECADRTALIATDATLTYRELNEKANVVAHNLIRRGIVPGDTVALLLPRESCFFACLFGTNKAGAAFIPCDPQYPADRINHIIEDSEAAFVVTTADKLAEYPQGKAILVEDLLVSDGKDLGNPDIPMADDMLSYMIYTSGSTGKPKGVMLTHRGICNYLLPHPANLHMYRLKERVETYLSITTVSFDMSFKEHTASLCNGKTLIFAGEDEMNDPRALTGLMEKYKVDCINATPSRLLQYLDYEPFREALAKCAVVMSGGEGYPMALRDRIRACAPDTEIINTYGPTEITVSCNAADVTFAKAITIGRPLLNVQEYVVDRFGDLAPLGVVGELYIAGTGVSKGYKNLPEKTKEAFVEYRGKAAYRSGDYAKWDGWGNVMILGRLDNQVKLRGLRIELGEISGLIEAQPHIGKTAVVIRKIGGQDNLCAYFTADIEIDIDELRKELKKHLTPYMIPTAYLQMPALPQTANGKTDLKALPEPVPVSLGAYVAPANETEAFFCETFKKVLNLEKVGATDDFFDIGGTSLVVTSIVLAAEEKGYKLTYGDVFKYTTPRALAKLFDSEVRNDKIGQLFDFTDYDYSKIDALLANNTVESFRAGEPEALGNILVTGATGYMGAHLVAAFLEQEKGKVYCLVRKGRYASAADRLKYLLFYYFGPRYLKEIEERMEVFDGDVTRYDSFAALEHLPIQTVFNCAANVKHFSQGTDIEDINVGGVENCIRFCEKVGAALVHFSTTSVCGTTEDLAKLEKPSLDEQSLFFGQDLDNKYTSSKLMGERKVLEAVAERGLRGKVIRVGTLAARESDGEFQINFLTNSFAGRLRSYAMLGVFPYDLLESTVCMGPIDMSCRAFLLLAKTPAACCLFNAINNHTMPLGDIIRRMIRSGMAIRFVEQEAFMEVLEEAERDPEKAAILASMTAYMGLSHGKAMVHVPVSSHYTTQVLARLGFFWNASQDRYVDAFVDVLSGFDFFDKENLTR